MVVGRHVPAGMLFVPSRDGLSHNPGEYTAPEQCELGARVLARALARADGGRLGERGEAADGLARLVGLEGEPFELVVELGKVREFAPRDARRGPVPTPDVRAADHADFPRQRRALGPA